VTVYFNNHKGRTVWLQNRITVTFPELCTEDVFFIVAKQKFKVKILINVQSEQMQVYPKKF
jgi:hypothetical protein